MERLGQADIWGFKMNKLTKHEIDVEDYRRRYVKNVREYWLLRKEFNDKFAYADEEPIMKPDFFSMNEFRQDEKPSETVNDRADRELEEAKERGEWLSRHDEKEPIPKTLQ